VAAFVGWEVGEWPAGDAGDVWFGGHDGEGGPVGR
jgi:hypothetical protein